MSHRSPISELDAGRRLAEAQERDHALRLAHRRQVSLRLRLVQSSLLVVTILLATVATVIAAFLFAGLLVHLLDYLATRGGSDRQPGDHPPPPIPWELVAPCLWTGGLSLVTALIRHSVLGKIEAVTHAIQVEEEAHWDAP